MRKAVGFVAGACVLWTLAYLAMSVVAFFMYFIAAFLDWVSGFVGLSWVQGITLVAMLVTLVVFGRAIFKAIFNKEN